MTGIRRGRVRAAMAVLASAVLATSAGCSRPTQAGSSASGDEDPLDVYYAAAYGSDMSADDQKRETDLENAAYQEVVAACMRAQGFDYQPGDGGTMAFTISMDDLNTDGPMWGTLEFARLYGYGIVEEPPASGADAATGECPGGGGCADADQSGALADARDRARAAMSTAEQAAYDLALWGDETETDPVTGLPVPGGCDAQGRAAVPMWMDGNGGPYADLITAMQGLDAVADDTPEMAEVKAAWSTCMTQAGFPDRGDPDQSYMDIFEQLSELNGGAGREVGAPLSDAEAALAEQEKSIAVADITCQDQMDYQARSEAVLRGVQRQFVAQHRAELTEWAAWTRAAREALMTPGVSPSAR